MRPAHAANKKGLSPKLPGRGPDHTLAKTLLPGYGERFMSTDTAVSLPEFGRHRAGRGKGGSLCDPAY